MPDPEKEVASQADAINEAAEDIMAVALAACGDDPAVALTIICWAALQFVRSFEGADDEGPARLIASLAADNPREEEVPRAS